MTNKADSDTEGRLPEIRGIELVEEVQRTGDSIIYRGRRGNRDYAVRVHRARANSDSETLEQFRKDAAVHASLEHPLIPSAYDVGLSEGRPYVVNDYIDGQTLREWRGEGPLSEDMVVVVGGAVAGALAQIHDRGLVHGEVTPDSIYLTRNGEIKLADHGLVRGGARGVDSRTGGVVRTGNRQYAAPEQAGLIDRPVDGRADLYALGVVLFEAVAGRPPAKLVDDSNLLNGHHAVAPSPLCEVADDVSPAFGAIVDRLLEGDPDGRFQFARHLKADLDRLEELNQRYDAGLVLGLGSATIGGGAVEERAFIARERELDELESAWERARTEEGEVLLVEGGAGSGKTRLVEKFLHQTVEEERRIISGRCLHWSPVPFAPLRTGLEDYTDRLRTTGSTPSNEARDYLAEAAQPFGGLLRSLSPRLAELFGEHNEEVVERDAHEVFYNAFASLFSSLSELVGGLVLWIDDAQWMGEATLNVLRIVASQVSGHPLLMIVTSRNGVDSREALQRLHRELPRESRRRLELRPFELSDVDRLVGVELGDAQPGEDFVEMLAERSQGNPFLVHQQLRTMKNRGLLSPGWGDWVVDERAIADIQKLEGAEEWVVERLRRLPRELRRVLAVASVVGAAFTFDQLKAVCREQPDAAVHRAIQIGLEEKMLERAHGSGEYTFAHDRIRDALRRRAERRRRVPAIRMRAAEYLDSLPGLRVRQLYDRARHYLAAAETPLEDRVVEALWEAGCRAVEEHAYDDAHRFLEALEEADAVDRAADPRKFHELAGTAAFRTDRFEQAITHYERALDSTEGSLRRARIRSELAQVRSHVLDGPKARQQATRAFDELEETLPTQRWNAKWARLLSILVHWAISRILIWTGWWRGSATGREELRQKTLVSLYDVRFHVGYYTRNPMFLLESAMLVLRPAHYLGETRESSIGLILHAAALAMVGRDEAAMAVGKRALRHAEWSADRQTLAFTRQRYAFIRSMSGHFDESVEIQRGLLERDHEWLDMMTFSSICIDLATTHLLRGDIEAGYEVTKRGLERLERREGPLWRVHKTLFCGRLATFAAMLGEFDEAERLRVRTMEYGADLDEDRALPWVAVWGFLANIALQERDFGERFERPLERLESFGIAPSESIHHTKHIYVVRAYGRLEQCDRSDDEDASLPREALESAVADLDEAVSTPTLRAHLLAVQGGLARLEGDREQARTLLAEARELSLEYDNVWAEFEARRQSALLFRARRMERKAERAAEEALEIAERRGWMHRIQELAEGFDLGLAAAKGAGRENRFRSSSLAAEVPGRREEGGEDELLTEFLRRVTERGGGRERLLRASCEALGASDASLYRVDADGCRLVTETGRAEIPARTHSEYDFVDVADGPGKGRDDPDRATDCEVVELALGGPDADPFGLLCVRIEEGPDGDGRRREAFLRHFGDVAAAAIASKPELRADFDLERLSRAKRLELVIDELRQVSADSGSESAARRFAEFLAQHVAFDAVELVFEGDGDEGTHLTLQSGETDGVRAPGGKSDLSGLSTTVSQHDGRVTLQRRDRGSERVSLTIPILGSVRTQGRATLRRTNGPRFSELEVQIAVVTGVNFYR